MPTLTDYYLGDDGALRRSLYTLGCVLIIVGYIQGIMTTYPLQLGNVQWRFIAAGSTAALFTLPLLGQTLIFAVARITANLNLARVMGVIAALTALMLLMWVGLFVLDTVQLRTIVKSQEMARFNRQAVATAITMITFGIGFSILALSALRRPKNAPKPVLKTTRKVADDGSLGLLIGQDYSDK
ncbi:MAG: hypothetical protein M3Y64_09120 [Gemmatimonadota bacterium]|nr:hypothetical protein [Gemmatimonadota bacterium]